MTSEEYKDVLALALGRDKPPTMSHLLASSISHRLKSRIISVRLASLTAGLDRRGTQTVHQHDSTNHFVLYVELEGAGQARFSMENEEMSEENSKIPALGVLMMKFQDLKNGSRKEVMSIVRPWKANVTTFGSQCSTTQSS